MSVFTTVSQALHTSEPLHQVLPDTLMSRLLYHHRDRVHLHPSPASALNGTTATTSPDYHQEQPAHQSTVPEKLMQDEQIQSLEYMYYATAVVAVFQILKVRFFFSPCVVLDD